MAAYNERHHPLIFNIILALYFKQSKCQAVLKLSTNNTDHPFTNKDNANNTMRPGQAGKLIANTLVNKKTAAIKLNRNTTLLKTFTKHLTHKNTTIYSLRNNTH